MAFPKFHGITLAAGAFIENATLERLAADPVPVAAGRLWYNTTDKVIKFSSLNAGGAIIIEVIATGNAAAALASRVTTLEGLVATLQATYINKDGSVAFTGDINAGGNSITNVAAPEAGTDAVNKTYVDNAIAVLGNAFEYVGAVEGGATEGAAFDLATLSKKEAGDYYKVTTAGYFKLAAATFYANVGDGVVFNTLGEVDKIDNTDSNVAGTASFITVTGSADTGFVVDIDSAFKARVATLETDLAAEVTRATNAESGLNTRLTTAEGAITTLQGQSSQLSTDLAAEVSRAQTAESNLQTSITNEENARAQGDSDLQDAIDAEVTARTTADTALSNDIAQVSSDLGAEVIRAQQAENDLQTDITQEISDRTAAITTVQDNIDTVAANLAAEVSRATGIEAGLQGAISDETTRAETAESSLNSAITAEATRATSAEEAINTKIGELSGLNTTDKSSIVAAINDLQVLAGGGTDALKSAINAQKFTYQAATDALVHTVQHNLNTAFPNVDIRVRGDDGFYRNDIVAFEETDANTITVYMTEARRIKVSVQNMSNLA
jgi:predicted  nucleic acid-binding Zn-ribbon protein